MKKFWCVIWVTRSNGLPNGALSQKFESLEAAQNEAKRRAYEAVKNGQASANDWVVAEALGMAQVPVPDIAFVEAK